MTTAVTLLFTQAQLRTRFLTILPRIKTHARIYFRSEKCEHRKADLVSEVVALTWKWFVRVAEMGKDGTEFASTLATYAARAVWSGRRLCGQLRAKDVLSEVAQRRHGFEVSKLPDYSTLSENPLAEALHDNTQTPPPDAAAFRCDFPAWLKTRTRRDRTIAVELARGERTKALARRFGLSQARVSQMRREFHDDWNRFCEPVKAEQLAGAAG